MLAHMLDQASKSRFQVPDYDCDSCSEHSREGSIQVLESHPRSFSVPSTDDESDSEESVVESIEVASSIQGDSEAESRPTSPEHGAVTEDPIYLDLETYSGKNLPQSNVRGLKLKGPSIEKVLSKPALAQSVATGSSRQDAINLEDEVPHQQCAPHFESDDEGPEVLPIQQPSPKLHMSPAWKEPEVTRQSSPPIVTDEEADLVTDDQVKRIIVETQARVAKENGKESVRHQSPEMYVESTIGATDGFDSTDDDGFGNDDFSDYSSEEETAECFSKLMNSEPDEAAPVESKPSVGFGKTDSQNSKPNNPTVSISDVIDVSESVYMDFSSQRDLDPSPPMMARAPSPSDAALARNSTFTPQNPPIFGSYYASGQCARDMQIDNPNSTDPGAFGNAPFSYQCVPLPPHPSYTEPDLQSKPYEEGPFTSRCQEATIPGYAQWAYNDGPFNRAGDKTSGTESSHPLSDYIAAAAEARLAFKLQAAENSFGSVAQPSSRNPTPLWQSSKSKKGGEGQSSKINIANLVNTSQVDDSRPLKRKADEMTPADEAEPSRGPAMTMKSTGSQSIGQPQSHGSNDLDSVHETQLPDAQARDVLPLAETTSPSQDSALEPIEGSFSTLSVDKAVEVEGPARKKARTSSSPAKGIGKFVSGVCVGLVGAFAAFVATIPASVHEEALRELANAA